MTVKTVSTNERWQNCNILQRRRSGYLSIGELPYLDRYFVDG